MEKMKFYRLDNIKKHKAKYNVIFGERSNGKTYAVCDEGLFNYCDTGKQMAVIRRWEEDLKGGNGQQFFENLVNNGLVEKYTKGQWNNITYYGKRWYLSKVENEKIIMDKTPFAFAFALTKAESYKSTSYPNITTILFDEFLTRKFELPNEFIEFTSILSTIIRLRTDVTIYMCGNTINKYSTYFKEMGLYKVEEMEKGDIDIYNYGDSGLVVAVEYADSPSKKGKPSDVYFAFNNPRLNMIKYGDWEFANYPHLQCKYKPKDIIFKYFINFNNHLLQCEIICVDDSIFTYIHKTTFSIEKIVDEVIFDLETSYKPNRITYLNRPANTWQKKIYQFYLNDKVFYQDNDTGEIVRNYLNQCKIRGGQ